jgi:hypothetical protein
MIRRRGESDPGCLIAICLIAFLAICFSVGGDKDVKKAAENVAAEAKRLEQKYEERAGQLKAVEERLDYLEKRGVAQTVLNKAQIDLNVELLGRVKAIEERPHQVDGWQVETIPPPRVPTVPKDPD